MMTHKAIQNAGIFTFICCLAVIVLTTYPTEARSADFNRTPPKMNDYDYKPPTYLRGSGNPIEIEDYSYEHHRARIKYNYAEKPQDRQGLQYWILDKGVSNTPGDVWVECDDEANQNGGWDIKFIAPNATCWDSIKVRNVYSAGHLLNGGAPVQIVGAKLLTKDEVSIEPSSQCPSSGYSSPSSKEFCAFGSGIDGDTDDDMFRLDTSVKSYFEYDKLGSSSLSNLGTPGHSENYRLRYLKRSSGSRDMMMPSGPPGDYGDFKQFMDQEPLEVYNACYKAKINVCENVHIEADYKIDGVCGQAATEAFATKGDIDEQYQCAYGVPTTPVMNSAQTYFTWTCRGVGHDAQSSTLAQDATCQAKVSREAQCGAAHLQEFRNKDELTTSGSPYSGDLCSANSTVQSVTGGGPWFWTCNADVGPSKAYCTGLVQGQNCDRLFSTDKMVIVQDTSGSFGDDIQHTRNGLTYLFNNTLFKGWDVGITSYSDFGAPYGYRIDRGFTDLDTQKAALLNTYGSLSPWGGGDYPETQIHAMIRTIDDFAPQTNKEDGMVIVMITDATSHLGGKYGTMSTLAAKMREHNVRVIALTTSGAANFYKDKFRSAGLGDRFSQKMITSNSSNLAASLMEGLIDLGCDTAPIDGTCGLATTMPGHQYSSPDDILPGEACIAGSVAAMKDRGDSFTWVCEGINGGATSEQCTYLRQTCGNGVREGSEACDDGNGNNSDSCNNKCEKWVYNNCQSINAPIEEFHGNGGYWSAKTTHDGGWRYLTEDDPETWLSSDPGTTSYYSFTNDTKKACDFTCREGYERDDGVCVPTAGADQCLNKMIADGVYTPQDGHAAQTLTNDGRCFGYYVDGNYPEHEGPSETYSYWQFSPANDSTTYSCCRSK